MTTGSQFSIVGRLRIIVRRRPTIENCDPIVMQGVFYQYIYLCHIEPWRNIFYVIFLGITLNYLSTRSSKDQDLPINMNACDIFN